MASKSDNSNNIERNFVNPIHYDKSFCKRCHCWPEPSVCGGRVSASERVCVSVFWYCFGFSGPFIWYGIIFGFVFNPIDLSLTLLLFLSLSLFFYFCTSPFLFPLLFVRSKSLLFPFFCFSTLQLENLPLFLCSFHHLQTLSSFVVSHFYWISMTTMKRTRFCSLVLSLSLALLMRAHFQRFELCYLFLSYLFCC